jgi:hypothetical protein
VIAEGDYDRRKHFCKWTSWSKHGALLDPKRAFFIDEALFHLSGYVSAKAICIGAVLTLLSR